MQIELRVGCVERVGWNVNCIADIRDLLTVGQALCSTGRCAGIDSV